MYTVRQILQGKGTGVWSIDPQATIYEALQHMAEHDVGALVVLDSEKLVGIFSERDYARKVILHGKSSRDTLIREVMTDKVISITPDTSTEQCMALMTEKHIRHLPVVDAGQVIGVISIGDVVKAIITKQEFVITQLENYISGER